MVWSENLDITSPAYNIAASQKRHIRVIAGPGTGKSFAMKRRVARLLEGGVQPKKILPVTFTRVAAEDLHRELVGMNVPGCQELQGVTLHSLALKILMRNHVLSITGRTPRPLNDFEIKSLEADLPGGVRNIRKKIKAYEAGWARLQRDEPGYTQTIEDREFEQNLLSWLLFHKAMLIGETIPQLYNYLAYNPAAAERSEFSHILVDEFQDLNKSEQGVISLLSENSEICIVGDDDQSIYSFKHAHPDGIREWVQERTGADDLTLGDCRRCPTRVVEMANSLIAHNRSRPTPRTLIPFTANGQGDVRIIQYRTLDAEVCGIVGIVSNLLSNGFEPGDILVLAQRGVIGTPIYEGLLTRGISARSYYAEAELDTEYAQRRFALLKLFVDREDRVALRWLLGLGHNKWHAPSYQRIRTYCETSGDTPWTLLEKLESGVLQIPYTKKLVEKFTQLKSEIEELNSLSGLVELTNFLFPDNDTGVRDIRAISLKILDTIENDDRSIFLNELTTSITKPEIPTEIEDVRIMSLHKSKGLSSPVTIIAGCVEGLLPKQPENTLSQADQQAQLEEQRRLFYVGISRVKASLANGKPGTLILTYSQQMPLASAMGAGISPASASYGEARLHASRFIRELGASAPTPIAG